MLCGWLSLALSRRVPAMFERPHHRRIGRVLSALDGHLLREANCLFGGGTAMALRFGEYRESVDMDFLVSDLDSYRHLRQLLTGEAGFAGLLRSDGERFRLARAECVAVAVHHRVDDGSAAVRPAGAAVVRWETTLAVANGLAYLGTGLADRRRGARGRKWIRHA